MSSFLLTQYTDSCLEIFLNNIIKMWEQFRFLEFAFIILFILIGQIFLMSSSDLVSELSTTAELHYFSDPVWLAAIISIKIYSNAEVDKSKILSDNKDKSGIYMWTNNINKKRYIGSSQYLQKRLSEYFSVSYLNKDNCMKICRAILKYGHSNFELIILEYCEPEKCLEREGYYQKTLNPEYNIAKKPGAPMSGRKHSDKTKKKISDAIKGPNNPMYGQNHSDESKKQISDALKGENHPNYGKPKFEGAGRPSQVIEVTDITNNTTTSYNSIREAARALNINESSIRRNLKSNSNKPYKKIYIFAVSDKK